MKQRRLFKEEGDNFNRAIQIFFDTKNISDKIYLKDLKNLNNEIFFLKNEINNLKILLMNKNNKNIGQIGMSMMNQMGGMDMNMMNQMGGMGGMDMNMMNQMGGMGGIDINMMNQMGGMNLGDNKGWNLIFENQNDKQMYDIRISENKTIREAINLYKIKSGREGKMKFIFNNKELIPEVQICKSGLNNLSRILVISLQI